MATQRQYEPCTVFNARIVDMRHLWNPSDTYKGQKTQKPNFFAMFIVKKTVAAWHQELALADVVRACGAIYQKNPHIVSWPVIDGDMPSPDGKTSEFAKGHWLYSASTGNPPNVELAQSNGQLVKLANKTGVKPGDYCLTALTAAVKQNDPRGVKFYLSAVVFSAPGEEIVFANSVSGAELMQRAQAQGLQVTGFAGAPIGGSFAFPGGGFTPPAPGGGAFTTPIPGGFMPPNGAPGFTPAGPAPTPGFGAPLPTAAAPFGTPGPGNGFAAPSNPFGGPR